jgi:hypothetical protein
VWKVGDGRRDQALQVRAKESLLPGTAGPTSTVPQLRSNGAPWPTVWNADDLHPLATIGPGNRPHPAKGIAATRALWTPSGLT